MGRNEITVLRLRYLRPGADAAVIECEEISSGKQIYVSIAEFLYITAFLTPGCRLNLCDVTLRDGVYSGNLLVYNPDYLVDITTVAGCFEEYGETELVSLVRHLEPDTSSQAMVLGNFAGELLDDTVRHGDGTPVDYPSAVRGFFSRNAMAICGTPDFDSAEFHRGAKIQADNIAAAVNEQLPAKVRDYDRRHLILEPTFFCEILGLQGRMDMISSSMNLLVEQKSGKGKYGSGSVEPEAKLLHEVQLLLYRALFIFGHGVPPESLHSYLLYSRYPQPLVTPRTGMAMLRRAMEMRNRIVAAELKYASAGGYSILESMTADLLNTSGKNSTLWTRFTRPRYERLLNSYHDASDTVRAYIRRMLEFVSREHLEAKTGFNPLLQRGGFSSLWNMSLRQRLEQGVIYCGMSIETLEHDPEGRVTALTLIIPDDTLSDAACFRTGDIVALYSYPPDNEPDIRRSIVVRATIAGFGDRSITLSLRARQPELLFQDSTLLWAVEPDFYDSTFRPLYRNIFSLAAADSGRQKLLLNPVSAFSTRPYGLKGKYGEFNGMVEKAMRAGEIFAIIGPPGTGKTSFGLMTVLQEELMNPGTSVILGAYTNRAVDEICGKLSSAGMDYVRLGTENGCGEAFHENLLGRKVEECGNLPALKKLIAETRVFVGTVHAVTSSPLLAVRSFSLAIIDEASQILEPHIAGFFLAKTSGGNPSVSRFLLIGDHRQLPAVVQQPEQASRVSEPQLNVIGVHDCRESYFERFLRLSSDGCGGYNPDLVYTFSRQGRMHGDVASFPSEMFYGGRLAVAGLPHQSAPINKKPVLNPGIGNMLNTARTIFIDVPTPSDIKGNVNVAEAEIAAKVALEIYHREGDNFRAGKTLGIIVPYRMQGAAVRSFLRQTGIESLCDITIDTVERYQGGQRDYIIYSTVAANDTHLAFLTSSRFTDNNGTVVDRKLNVALTRAREYNIVIGSCDILSRDPIYKAMTDVFVRMSV